MDGGLAPIVKGWDRVYAGRCRDKEGAFLATIYTINGGSHGHDHHH